MAALLARFPCGVVTRRRRGVTRPEILIADSAHAAYIKAAEYFNMRLVQLPVGKDLRLSGAWVIGLRPGFRGLGPGPVPLGCAHAAMHARAKANAALVAQLGLVAVAVVGCCGAARAVRAALTGQTAVVVASAPGFPHGVIDDVEGIAKVRLSAVPGPEPASRCRPGECANGVAGVAR